MLILKSFKISLQVAFFFHQVLYMYFLWTQDSDHITIPNYSKNLLFKKKEKNKDFFSTCFFFCLPAQLPRYTV